MAGDRPRERALRLLAAWGEPDDAALVAPWIARMSPARPPDAPIWGDTIDEVCDRFQSDRVFPPRRYATARGSRTVVTRDGGHARTVCTSGESDCCLDATVFLVRDKAGWRLQLLGDVGITAEIDHE